MSGISWDSSSKVATITSIAGAWDANYPIANLADLVTISNVARVTPAGGVVAIQFEYPSATTLGFIGLVNHTIGTGATLRVRLYAGPNLTGTLVHDSGVVGFWPSGGPKRGLRTTRPYIPSLPVLARSGRIDIGGLAGAVDIGGLELAKHWQLNIGPGREIGFLDRGGTIKLLGAGNETVSQGAQRAVGGEITHLALAIAATTGLDFQTTQGKGKPFVYVDDYDNPASWARRCFLVTNRELPPSVGRIYRHDTFQFRFAEHFK